MLQKKHPGNIVSFVRKRQKRSFDDDDAEIKAGYMWAFFVSNDPSLWMIIMLHLRSVFLPSSAYYSTLWWSQEISKHLSNKKRCGERDFFLRIVVGPVVVGRWFRKERKTGKELP